MTHNAGRSLATTIDSLARQRHCGHHSVRFVIAVNGFDQETFDAAHQLLPRLRRRGFLAEVVSTSLGRSVALNAAESRLPDGVRVYVDQDAVLSPTAIADLSDVLARGSGRHFAALRLMQDNPGSLVTRWFYRVWSSVPYVRASPVTIGLYAVSADGRSRWGQFPPLSNDDKFVRLQFAPFERAVVDSATYSVTFPVGLREVVRARRRYIRYNRDLIRSYPSLQKNDLPRYAGAVGVILRRPTLWLPCVVFLLVNVAAAFDIHLPSLRRAISRRENAQCVVIDCHRND